MIRVVYGGVKAFRQNTCAIYQSFIKQAFRHYMEGLKRGELLDLQMYLARDR